MADTIFSTNRNRSMLSGRGRVALRDQQLTPDLIASTGQSTSSYLDSQERAEAFDQIPSYMLAASTHTLANNTEEDQSFLDSTGEMLTNIPIFLAASTVSAVTQLYNIAPSLGNFFGGDYDLANTAEVMQDLDDDLGSYYGEHEGSVDTVGFMLSAMIPGLGGIKVLNAGQKLLRTSIQSGRFGNNMGKALGLLAPNREKYLKEAMQVINTDNPFKLMEKSLLNTMARDFGQNMLEAAAFETAVATTLFNSPILEQQDKTDLLFNIVVGGIAFGTIGGVMDATRSAYKVKNHIKVSDPEAMPWRHIEEPAIQAPASDKILTYANQIHNMPAVPRVLKEERISYLEGSAKARVAMLETKIRGEFTVLAEGDQAVAQVMHDATKLLDNEATMHNYLGAKSISRISEITAVEAKEVAKKASLAKGKNALLNPNLHTTFHKVWGEEAGNITGKASPTRLVDDLKKGEDIVISPTRVSTVNAKGVASTVAEFKRPTAKQLDNWDITKASLRESEARAIWASEQKLLSGQTILENDLPLLEQAYKQFDPSHRIHLMDGGELAFQSPEDLLEFIYLTKAKLIDDALRQTKPLTPDEIATKFNVKSSWIAGDLAENKIEDVFAMDVYAADYAKQLKAAGLSDKAISEVKLWKIPQHIKTVTDTSGIKGLTNMEVEAMAIIKQRQIEYKASTDRVFVQTFGEDSAMFGDITDELVLNTSRISPASGWAAAASGNYGSLAALTQQIGKSTTIVTEKWKSTVREAVEAPLYKLAQNTDAAIEFSTHNNTLRGIPMNYTLNEAGDALIPLAMHKYLKAKQAGRNVKVPVLKIKEAPLEIPVTNEATRDLIKLHIELNDVTRAKQMRIRNAQGGMHTAEPGAFYPTPPDPTDYPFFAAVIDNNIAGLGHTKMLVASSEQELSAMVGKLANEPGLRIIKKQAAEDHWRSVGQFDYDKTLHDTYMDTMMHRKGVSQPYLVSTDPKKIADEFLNWHLARASGLVREAVSMKYERPFAELRSLGKTYTETATSKKGSLSALKHAESIVENPFDDYIKTSLAIKNYSDYPFWTSFNRMVDAKASQMYSRITATAEGAKSSDDLLKINETLREYGYKGAAYDEKMELLANHTAPRGVLSNFVQKANALLATVVLRLDPLNALNNAFGANVLLSAETSSVIRAIERGDARAVGALAQLAKVKVPGTDKLILSPSKMIATSIKRFNRSGPEMQFYKDNRFVTSISDQYRWTIDQLTLRGKESASELSDKISAVHKNLVNAADKGERWTGNRLAEEFNRFVAADVMKQLTDVAVKHNLMDGKTALAYINTFVNRTQGNYLASQRPMMFQGAVGQSIGLFQTYQFNLMQQLLRHVGEGKGKDVATLLGMQGAIYGMNGLPAFNAINTHILGTASGNTEHKDMYDAVYGAAGKDAGDWLMYGLSSNFLLHPDAKVNLYVRGDINPRHLTIVPTDPASVPIVQASAKFFANLLNTGQQLMKGGNVATTLLQGIEHNGISRPLAGLAQTLEGLANPLGASYSSSRRGNVIASNDLLSLANMARIVGGKPLGEAIAIDATFRFRGYAAKDSDRKRELGQAIKTTMIAGKLPTQEQIDGFSEAYASIGGKQTEFNQYMMNLYKTANLAQANKLQQSASSPFSQSMQTIMGGYELRDFAE